MGYAVTDEGEAKKYYEMKKDYRLCVFWAAIWLSLSVPLPVSARQPDCQRQNPSVSQQILSDNKMDDKSQIEALYKQMYRAMVEKDTVTLDELHADEFVLTHMTGMRQSKQENIRAIANGTLNYYEVTHEQIDIRIDGNRATLTGRSRVSAAVFGGGRHTWRLQLTFHLVRRDGKWLFTDSKATTY